jgi:hypothetical protein
MFFKPKWYNLLPERLKPKKENILEDIENLRKKYGFTHEVIYMYIILTPWAVRTIQKDCLEQGRRLMPNASEQELWKGVLLSRLQTKLAANIPTAPWCNYNPLPKEDLLSMANNVDNICAKFKSWDDVVEYIVSMERDEGTFLDPSGILNELDLLLGSWKIPEPFKSAPSFISQPSTITDTKKCPFCAEEIKKEALKCRYCHSDINKKTGVDGSFIAYDNGIVLDTQTNLMWAARDNGSNLNWADAKAYCESYRGGGYTGWRMPTQDELAGLYNTTKTYRADSGVDVHLTKLIRLTSIAPWASEKRGSDAAYFSFFSGNRGWLPRSNDNIHRALPVRSAI